MRFEIVLATRLDRIVNEAISIQNDLNCLISTIETYLIEIQKGSDKRLSQPMIDYINFIRNRAFDSIRNFEIDLDSISNYEIDTDLSLVDHVDFSCLELLKGPGDGLVYIVEEYIEELEFVRDFLDDIITQVNDQRTSALVESSLIN